MITIGINADAKFQLTEIPDAGHCIVIDNFLSDPEAIVRFARDHADEFEEQQIGYPGVLYDVPKDAMTDVRRFLRLRMSRQFSFLKGGIRLSTYLSMATRQPGELAPLQRLPHSDPRQGPDRHNYAALVYLFDNEGLGGTGFYRWKQRPLVERATAMEIEKPGSCLELLQKELAMFRESPRYMTGSNEVAELLLEITPRFNRFVFYSGDIPHSAHIPHPELLTTDFSAGRLTLNCFASVRAK